MEEVYAMLKRAGFFIDRNVDITVILKMYDANGYKYDEHQIDFMQKYSNLEIHYKHPIWHTDMVVRIDPIAAQKAVTMDAVEEYNTFLEDELLI